MKKNIIKKRGIVILLLLILIIIVIFKVVIKENTNEKKVIKKIEEKVKLNEYVKTNKITALYLKDNNKYKKIGEIGQDILLHITNDRGDFYKIADIEDDYYIKSDNLSNYEKEIKFNDRYENYIVFNKNVNTHKITSLYDENDNLIYTINKDMSFPIIVMEKEKVGVIFNKKLLYIKISDNSKIVDNNNTEDRNIEGIGVLNYHFFYDDSNEDESKCDQDICMPLTKLKEQLDYIKENNYFTPTMKEFEMYIDGKIQLPKSVVITIDDGWRALEGTKIITEYKLNATVFVITGVYNPNDYKNEFIEVHSHSDNMHNKGDCPTGQGGGIQCLSEETILNDLKTSSEKLGESKVFCYPFYEYNNYSISMLKKAGYTMAFAGEEKDSNNITKVGTNKYEIPRFVMVNYTTMNDFSRYLDGKFYS